MGDSFLVLDFGDKPHSKITEVIVGLTQHWELFPLPGVSNITPSICSIGFHYDPSSLPLSKKRGTVYSRLVDRITQDIGLIDKKQLAGREIVHVPVTYGGEFGRDFDHVLRKCGLSREEFIDIHCARSYIVYMIGFAPGFPYLGPLDDRLIVPRKNRPREKVPLGSVAIASSMTGIYPGAYPGGWNLIGRTPMKMFDISQEKSSRLVMGDRVKFYPIDQNQFQFFDEKKTS